MFQKDYDVENNVNSVERSDNDDTLYVLKQFLYQYHDKKKPVLDLGSGDGHYHNYFPDYKFVAMDIRKNFKNKDTDTFVNHDIEQFPYVIANELTPFEFVFSLDVFEHLQRPDKVLDYLMQDDHILKKGGYIFISVPNVSTLDDKLNGVNQALYNPRIKNNTGGRWNSTHIRFFDTESLCELGSHFGYKIEFITGSNFLASDMFQQLISTMNRPEINIHDIANVLRNTDFMYYAPNICILLRK